MKRQLASFLTSSLFFLTLTSSAHAESSLAEIQRTGILSVAIREDAAPLGYLNSNNKLQGYCLDFFCSFRKAIN